MMSVGTPWFLFTLLAIPIYYWLRRRANVQSRTEFTGGFLVGGSLQEGLGVRHTGSKLEDLLCCICILCLSFAGAAVSMFSPKSVVIVNGPVTLSDSIEGAPIVRAGIYPTVHVDGAKVRYVDTPPDWRGALRFARARFPDHSIYVRKSTDVLIGLQGAGIRRSGREWNLGVHVHNEVLIQADSDGGPIALRPTSGGFASEALPASDWIEIKSKGYRSQYVCGIGKRLLSLRKGVLPEPVQRGLALHPLIQIVDEGGDFEVESPQNVFEKKEGDTPFPVDQIKVVFEAPTDSESLELRLGGELSLPVAQVHEWTGLPRRGVPFLFAGINELLTFSRSGTVGMLRFGFRVEDTDLVDTAGWPVLMMQLGDHLVDQTRDCFESQVGQVVHFEATTPITLVGPDGAKRIFKPLNGRVSIGGIDEIGRYKLVHGSNLTWLLARPSTSTNGPKIEDVSQFKTSTRVISANTPSLPFVIFAACLLLLLALVGTRRRWYLAGVCLLALAPNAEREWFGSLPEVTVLLDVSPSMRGVEVSLDTFANIEGLSSKRVDFAQDVIKIVNLEQPPSNAASSVDLAQVLSSLAALGKRDNPVLLITDGRFRTPELSFPHPVHVMMKVAAGQDPRLVSATAVEMADGVYVRATIHTDGPVQGELFVRGKRHPFTFGRAGQESMSVMLPKAELDRELVEIIVPNDRDRSNNSIRIDVQRPLRSDVLVLGQCGVPINNYLKEAHRVTRFEQEMDFSKVQLAVICDQSIEEIPTFILNGLSKWLENGGTLLLAGRERAFGNGGWGGSVLEHVSPFLVDPEPEGRGTIQLSVALDTSGSMSELAGGVGLEGLRKIVPKWTSMLNPRDRISIVGFDTRVNVLLDDVSASDWLEKGWEIPVETGGGTRLANLTDWVVRTAQSGLRRYLVLVTDGAFADKTELSVQAEQLRRAGVVVLAVGVGDEVADELLCKLARDTGGQCLMSGVDQAARFVASAVLSNNGALDVAGGLVSSTPLWKLRVGGSSPSVERKIRVSADDNARVLAQQQSSPLAAERYRGLGRVIAIATDYWALSHEQWRNLLSPALNQRDVNFSLTIVGNQLEIKGRPMMSAPSALPSYRIDTEVIEGSPWQLIEPGHFITQIPNGVSGEMIATVVIDKIPHQYRFEVGKHQEWTSHQLSQGALMSLARRTKGSFVNNLDELRHVLSERRRSGGVPSYFFVLLGVIIGILVSVKKSENAPLG
jgi:hypothetical protein